MKRIYTITTIIMAALAIAGCAKELEENNQVPKEDPKDESKEEPKDDPKVEDGTMLLGAMLPDYPDASDYDAAAQSAARVYGRNDPTDAGRRLLFRRAESGTVFMGRAGIEQTADTSRAGDDGGDEARAAGAAECARNAARG